MTSRHAQGRLNANTATATFTAPNRSTVLVFELRVSANSRSSTDQVSIRVSGVETAEISNAILPELARAMTDSTVAAISDRIGQAVSDRATPALQFAAAPPCTMPWPPTAQHCKAAT